MGTPLAEQFEKTVAAGPLAASFVPPRCELK